MFELAPFVCESAVFDRLIIVGGETSQAIFRHLHVNHLELGRALSPALLKAGFWTALSLAENLP